MAHAPDKRLVFGNAALLAAFWAWGAACANTGGAGSNVRTSGESSVPTSQQSNQSVDVGDSNAGGGARFIGRVGAGNVMSWSGTALEQKMSGNSASFSFALQSGNATVGLSVDGGPVSIWPIASGNTSVAVSGLSRGIHTLRLTKLSEGRLGEIAFLGGNASEPLASASAPNRRIEVIGDSITAAYGVLGQAPCNNNVRLEDATASFASLAASTLQADVSLLGWAGKGVWRNDVSDLSSAPVTMRSLWWLAVQSQTSVAYNFGATAPPDAVVIALGTNDYEYMAPNANGILTAVRPSIDHNAFVSAYLALLDDVHTRYPQARFVLCGSPMLSDTTPTVSDAQHTSLLQDLNTIADQFSAAPVAVLDFAALDANLATGCGGHPNVAGQAQMAEALVTQLRTLMSW